MKTLRTLAVLPLIAAVAHAESGFTVDITGGYGKPRSSISGSNYDNNAVVGIGFGKQLNENFHIGLNFSSRDVVDKININPVDATARTLILDVTYELNGTGGIKPFVGIGLGYAWTKNTLSTTGLAADVNAGIRFELSEQIDLILMGRNIQVYNIDFDAVDTNQTVRSWEAIAGVRFKF